jgi:hypothetical protein
MWLVPKHFDNGLIGAVFQTVPANESNKTSQKN